MNVNWQCPQCKSPKVTAFGDNMMCLSCGYREYLYDYSNTFDTPGYVPPEPDIAELEDRINDLEAMSAEPGSIPQYYFEQMQQLKGQVNFLQGKVNDLSSKRKRKQDKITGITPL